MKEQLRYTAEVRTLVFVFRGSKLLMMKYSGTGEHQSQEKADRAGVFNPIGGHVEEGEDVAENAAKEAMEEAGVTLLDVKIRGVINVSGFAGKNMVNFIVRATTDDEPVTSSAEGELHWVDAADVPNLKAFDDVKPILDKLEALKNDEMIVGTARFSGFELAELRLRVI